jgi:hypothetical protein
MKTRGQRFIEKRRLLGQCRRCTAKPVDGSAYCERHMKMSAADSAARRVRFKKLGQCVRGCGHPVAENTELCKTHRDEKQAAHRRVTYSYTLDDEKFFKAAELCDWCHQPFAGETPEQDHDHACCAGKKGCGKCNRGLLHHNCNWMALPWAEWQEKTFGVTSLSLKRYRECWARVWKLLRNRGMTRRAACVVINASVFGLGCIEGEVRVKIQAANDRAKNLLERMGDV